MTAKKPPTSAYISLSSNGGVSWSSNLQLSSPFTSGSSQESTNYPNARDTYIRFTLYASKNDENHSQSVTVYFRNWIRWGVTTKSGGYNSSDINNLTGVLSNDHTRTVTVGAGSGQYIIFAHPAGYNELPQGTDYESNGGGTGFIFNGMTCAFQAKEEVLVTNSKGFTEYYYVYRSTLTNLGTHTLTTYTSRQAINKIYYGTTTKTSNYTQADVKGLEKSEVTNDSTQVWDTLTAGSGEYLLFAFPKRWGEKGVDYSFYDYQTGFEAAFLDPEVVSVTNENGWSEDFYVYRSENANLGTITVETK